MAKQFLCKSARSRRGGLELLLRHLGTRTTHSSNRSIRGGGRDICSAHDRFGKESHASEANSPIESSGFDGVDLACELRVGISQ